MKHIFHPTDLRPGSTTAFLHALRLATTTQSVLTILHADRSGDAEWADLPGVRSTLARWRLVRDENDMDGLKTIGIGVRKILADKKRPVKACLDHLKDHPTDLIVLSTHQADGGLSLFGGKVAEPLARGAGEPCLLVPHDRPGFVDPTTGAVNIRRVLVPITTNPDPRRALDAARRIIELLDQREVVFTLLHVGTASTAPLIELEPHAGWTFERVTREGDPVEVIVQTASGIKADLVVMATKGHDGFLDVFRGSNTERVLRQVQCPLLAVPA
ncbi:MAG TPA: universal stress protein [Flavobacteriales bacterium]|nr:universal stress protein [Flavobacteriales bacterium]